MDPKLNEEQQQVWKILSTPYSPPVWNGMTMADINKFIDEIKEAIILKNEVR